MKRLIGLWLFLLLCALPVRAETEQPVIRVGYSDFSQFVEQAQDGSYSGYAYEYLDEIAARTGWRYEFVLGTPEQCLERLAAGEVDLLCMMQYSSERAEQFAFTRCEAGLEYTMLLVDSGNTSVYYNDYAAFDGMRIGLLKGYFQDALLQDFALKKGFTYEAVHFEFTDQMSAALDAGEVDAILCGDLQRVSGKKVVAKFSPAPYYFCVRKGNEALHDTLEEAMEEILTTDSDFNTNLYKKYYGDKELNSLALTRQEAEFVRRNPVLRVTYNADWSPVQYLYRKGKNSHFAGVCAGIMDILAQKSGVRFEYIPVSNMEESVRMIQDGEADLICGLPSRYPGAVAKRDIVYSKPFLDVAVTLAKPADKGWGDVSVVAVPKNIRSLSLLAAECFPSASIVSFANTDACFEAVLQANADAVFDNIYVLDQYTRDRRYADMESILSMRVDLALCIGVSAAQDPALCTLLNKLISEIDRDQVNEMVVESTMEGPHIHMDDLFRRYVFIISIAIVGALLFLNYHSKLRVERYAFVDPLTGRDNETKFLLSAEKLLRLKGYEGFAVVSLDIDRFKLINNMHNFETGNRILRGMSDVLADSMGAGELFCRKADDRYVALMRDIDHRQLDNRIHQLIRSIDALPRKFGENFQYTVSCGVYPLDSTDHDIHRAIGWANLARKSAKGHHVSRVVYYDEAMRRKVTREQEIENRMNDALEHEEFKVYLQPKVFLDGERTVGAEALVRWFPGDGSAFYPDEFIPVFEKNGFVMRLDLYVFERVCRTLRCWLDAGFTPCPVSVNLSRLHLNQPDFYQQYLDLLERYHVSPRLVELELTESALFENQARMIALIRTLKSVGLSVSMDDFGSGYSSLNLMKDLPLDGLKLDKEFFNTSSDTQRGQEVIRSVVAMAENLHITVVAEGVETEKQVEFLQSIHCNIVQGYYYAKPMPVKDFEAYAGFVPHSDLPAPQTCAGGPDNAGSGRSLSAEN